MNRFLREERYSLVDIMVWVALIVIMVADSRFGPFLILATIAYVLLAPDGWYPDGIDDE